MTQPLIKRCGDSGDLKEFASEIAVTKIRESQLLTAIQSKEGRLKLISWKVQRDGSVLKQGDSGEDGEEATKIAIARGKKIITVHMTSSKNLQLISWTVNKKGEIERITQSDPQPEIVEEIKIAMISLTLFVTACRTAENQLKLISWRLKQNGTFTRLDAASVPSQKISEISLHVIPDRGYLISSVGTDRNLLKLYVWNVSSRGKIKFLCDSGFQAGSATIIRSVYSNAFLVTSGRAGNGRLKLISWSIGDDGKTITRVSDSGDQAGVIIDNALMSLSGKLVSAIQTSSDNLKLITWHLGSIGTITRIGDSGPTPGEVSLVTLSREAVSRRFPIVTAVRHYDLPSKEPSQSDILPIQGYLKLTTWTDK